MRGCYTTKPFVVATFIYLLCLSTNAPLDTNGPADMVFIPAGSFIMGDAFMEVSGERPTHTVRLSAFYMDKYEVTKALWDDVYQWAINHGYSFSHSGDGKGTNHPVQNVSWGDCAKWCNARSRKEGRIPAYYTDAEQTLVFRSLGGPSANSMVKWNAGYRLPTEAEWEYAARGGLVGNRFPWGNTISHSQANFNSDFSYSYDASATFGYHPSFQSGGMPFTSPVGSFAPNRYGLYDMAGNVWEMCWDRYYFVYPSGNQTDPRGPDSGLERLLRGGCWNNNAINCRVSNRNITQGNESPDIGFRCVLPADQ